jgi:adenylate cyclase
LSYNGNHYPSLALAAILLATPERTLRLTHDGGETTMEWGNRLILLDRQGNLLLDFRSEEHSFPYFSVQAIMSGTQAAGSLQGKIVLVGSWAKGLGDVYLVPSGQALYGLMIHATVIDNIIAGTLIFSPGWARAAVRTKSRPRSSGPSAT